LYSAAIQSPERVEFEAAKLAPRWNPQLAAVHARELERGHRNRATLAVARNRISASGVKPAKCRGISVSR
jgi:hypothetical protein